MMLSSPHRIARFAVLTALFGCLLPGVVPAASAAQLPRRLAAAPANGEERVALPGSVSPRTASARSLGHLSTSTVLTGMSLVLKPTAAQDAALSALIAAQQDPSSPQYHQWLTPESFGAQFGVADADLDILREWLAARGFTVDEVTASRNRIVFTGTSAAVESAFGVTMQRFQTEDGQSFFENADSVQLPASLSGVVGGVSGLSSYHLKPSAHRSTALPAATSALAPQYTSGTGAHYLVPWDFRQIYSLNTLISSGYDGTGIKIGVIGQSSVSSTQLTYFQQKTGQTVKLPTMVLVPHTGTSGQLSTSDEGESELDLEYASGSAPGATVLFIYTGLGDDTNGTNGNNDGVFDALIYGVTSNLAPILSISYGGCETSFGSYATTIMEPYLRQANAQGQTIVVASGDNGSAGCETSSSPTIATGGLRVDYPSSSSYVTGIGGTQLTGTSSTYWSSSNNSYGGSAVGYIPEVAWNETVTANGVIYESGGGASALFSKPSWQTGTGVPADGRRDVPDVSFPAAVYTAGYLVCTVESQCTTSAAGFASGNGGLIGGTSVGTPNFAAMLAIVEQANGGAALGNINPTLYTLAAGSSASTIFHDITSGNNIVACRGGTTGCSSTVATTSGTMGYSTGTGYDQVTGLGSVDASGLRAALKGTTTTTGKLTPTVNLSAATTTPLAGATDLLTVATAGSGATPTGSISLSIDGAVVSTITLASGSGTYTYTAPACTTPAACTHTVIAAYSGDSAYNSGAATLTLTVAGTGVVSNGTISMSSSQASVTVKAGSNVSNTIVVTSNNGFAGTVSFTAQLTSANASSFHGCYTMSPVTLAANGTVNATINITTSTASCVTSGATTLSASAGTTEPTLPFHVPGSGLAALAACLLGGFTFRRRIRPAGLLVLAVSALTLTLAGCGSGGTAATTTTTTTTSTTTSGTGTYTVQVIGTGVPSSGSSVTANTSFTIVVN